MEKIKALLGLGPEADEGAVADRVLEVLGDLAAALKLPRDASVSQISGAPAALQAGERRTFGKTPRNWPASRRAWPPRRGPGRGRGARYSGKISPAQKEWALEYFRQAPEGFATYVARAPKPYP